MEQQRRDLPCDTCRDLIPLVLDGAASESSRRLVEEHIAHCGACRAFYGAGAPIPEPDDIRVLGRVRRWLWLWAITLAGLLLCAALVESGPRQGRFAIGILAALGALACRWGGRRWYLHPGGMAVFAFVWHASRWVPELLAGALSAQSGVWFGTMFAHAFTAGGAAAALGLLGGAAAALFRYAFAKEDAP